MGLKKKFYKVEATIASSESVTDEISIGHTGAMQAIEIPSGWTTANLTFQASTSSTSGGNYVDVYDADGNEVTAVVGGTDRIIAVDPTIFAGFSFIKIRSGTVGTPVAQGADRTINILVEAHY